MNDSNLKKEVAALRAQGVPEELVHNYVQMQRMTSRDVPMSRQDGVSIYQDEGDTPGVYISSEQAAVDAYNKALVADAARREMFRDQSRSPISPIFNPNYQVVTEGQHQTVDNQGHIIIA